MRSPLIIALLLQHAAADLTCLEWALISAEIGVICHLAPKKITNVETAVVEAVNTTIEKAEEIAVDFVNNTIHKAENAVDFSIHYNPITLAYNYIDTADRLGWAAANAQFREEASTIGQVTVGFAKTVAAMAYIVAPISIWQRIATCLIDAEVEEFTGDYTIQGSLVDKLSDSSHSRSQGQARNSSTKGNSAAVKYKRALASNASTDAVNRAVGAAKKCLNPYKRPLTLKISNSEQQIGADIADVAGLLVPVAGEEAVAVEAAEEAAKVTFDLALPGAEDTTRILKYMKGQPAGAHFETLEEAESVSANLAEDGWLGKNCQFCEPPITGAARRLRRRGGAVLMPRGNSLSMCCPVGEAVFDKVVGDGENYLADAEMSNNEEALAGVQSEEESAEAILEAESTGSTAVFPNLPMVENLPLRPYDTARGYSDLANDFKTQNSGAVGYSSKLSDIASSDEIMKIIQDAVQSKDSSMRDLLNFVQDDFRWTSSAKSWLSSTDQRLSTIQKWMRQALADTEALASKLVAEDKTMSEVFKESDLTTNSFANLFYIEPTVSPTAFDFYFGLHVDEELISFSTSNTPGLSVRTGVSELASDALTPVVDNSFYLVRGQQWVGTKGTQHAVHLEQAFKTGRPSIVIKTNRISKNIKAGSGGLGTDGQTGG